MNSRFYALSVCYSIGYSTENNRVRVFVSLHVESNKRSALYSDGV